MRHGSATAPAGLLAALLVAACGGGGGAPIVEPPIAVHIAEASLVGQAFQGQGTIQGTTAGRLGFSGTLGPVPTEQPYVYPVTTGPGLAIGSLFLDVTPDGRFTASVPPDASLPPGVYEGTLRLDACHDQACARPYVLTGNSIPFRVTITPVLGVQVLLNGAPYFSRATGTGFCGPGAAAFAPTVLSGDTLRLDASVPVTVAVAPEAGVSVAPLAAEGGSAWRGVLEGDGTPATCFDVTATDGSGQRLSILLKFRPPTVLVPAGTIELTGSVGQTAPLPSATVPVTSENGRAAPFLASVESNFLTVTTTGATPGEVQVRVNRTDLSAGTYLGTLVLSPLSGAAPAFVPIRYVLGTPAATPAGLALTVDAATTPAQLGRTVALSTGGAGGAWSAVSDQPWVRVSPASGPAGTDATVTVDPDALTPLAGGRYAATLDFTLDAGGGATVPVRVPVALTLDLPKADRAMPHASVAGLGSDVLVWGSGFPAGFAGPVLVGGEPAPAVSRVSATALRVTLPAALPAGTWPVVVENALGLDRSAASVALVAPAPARAGAAVPSAGLKVAAVFDDVRRALYVANAGTGVLERYREAAGWTRAGDGSDALDIPGLRGLAATPDGADLLAVGATAFRLVDPDALSLRAAQPTATPPPGSPVTLGMTGTNQALYVGYATGHELTSGLLDLATGTEAGYLGRWYGWVTGSADGARAVAAFAGGDSFLLWDGAPPLVISNTWQEALFGGQDRHAERLMLFGAMGYEPVTFDLRKESRLYDAALQPLPGTVAPAYILTPPAGAPAPAKALALSPLGRPRAYTWDGALVTCYDLDAPLDPLGVYQVRFTVAAASPGADAVLVLSADERTAFLAGDAAVVVVPLPE